MIKHLRLKSIIMILCMAFAILPGFTALADDGIAVLSWDADSDFITLDFNIEADISSIESGISLMKGEAAVDVTVEYSRHASADSLEKSNGAGSVIRRYTYLIKTVDESIEFDTLYTLTLTDVSDASGTSMIPFWSKSFAVEKLAEGTNVSDNEWTVSQNSDTNNTFANDDNGNIKFSFVGSNSGSIVLGNKLGDASAWNKDLKDYTVKITLANLVNETRYNLRFGSHMSSPGYQPNAKGFRGIYIDMQTNVDGMKRVVLYQRVSNDTLIQTPNVYDNAWKNDDITQDMEFKLSARDDLARAFINGVKAADILLSDGSAGVPVLSAGVANTNDKDGADVVAKNFLMTRAVEYHLASIDKTWDVEIDDTVVITLPKAITEDYSSSEYIKLSTDGAEADDYSVSLSDDGLQLTIAFAGLENKSEYTISFEGLVFEDGDDTSVIPVSFNTIAPAFDLDSFRLYDAYNDEAPNMSSLTTDTFSVEATVANNRLKDAQTFTATVCIYNSKNQMVAADGGIYTLAEGESQVVKITDFEGDADETYTAKCFVWDSLSGMNTIFEGYID